MIQAFLVIIVGTGLAVLKEEQVWLVGKIKWSRTLFANQQLSSPQLPSPGWAFENTQWRKVSQMQSLQKIKWSRTLYFLAKGQSAGFAIGMLITAILVLTQISTEHYISHHFVPMLSPKPNKSVCFQGGCVWSTLAGFPDKFQRHSLRVPLDTWHSARCILTTNLIAFFKLFHLIISLCISWSSGSNWHTPRLQKLH